MGLALGIDLGGTKTEAAVLDAAGTVAWRERVPTPAGDYRATLRAVTGLVQRARAALGQPLTIGIGHPGTLTAAGRIKNANSICLNGQALAADLAVRLGQPVRLANDANCLALSEATDGAGAGAPVVFAVILGTGTGAGIAVQGRVLTGINGLAGEWGHNPLPWADADEQAAAPACYCGQRGCVETWVSGPALALDHHRHGGPVLTGEQIVAAAAAGDAAAEATLERHAQRLARALAAVINLLDPDVIVLGGGLSRLGHLFQRVPALWPQWAFSAGADEPVRTRLLPARHGDASGVRGAAWLWR
jgi:fructokinase